MQVNSLVNLDIFFNFIGTAWCLLFMLAVYDLCAVLTPCGPLKALVNLMQHEDAPEMVRTKRVLAKQ